jgi:hypothetical protein
MIIALKKWRLKIGIEIGTKSRDKIKDNSLKFVEV